jgi:hypothetical protein
LSVDLIISYQHDPVTGEPLFAGNQVAECVARDVRQQLTGGNDRVLAIDLERLTRVRTIRVNDIGYEFEWSTDGPVTDEAGKPVLGICEVDPDGLPDAALIYVNPELVDGRSEILLSTGAHEMGHGIFEAPPWIHAERNAAMPSLFDGLERGGQRRVLRTITPSESHLCATYPPGSKEFFQEARANEFMGSLLTPRRLLSRQFAARCEALGLRPVDFLARVSRTLLSPEPQPAGNDAEGRPGNLSFLNLHRTLKLQQVVLLLARDFGVTRRFIEVRLKRYGLLRQEVAIV